MILLKKLQNSIDAELVELATKGHSEALDVLILRYQNRILKIVSRYVEDKAEALDLSQEVLIKVYRALPSFKQNSSFYTWLYRIVLNSVKNYYRLNASRLSLGYNALEFSELNYHKESCLQDNTSPEDMACFDEMGELMLVAFNELPKELSDSMLLFDVQGLSYDEIAEKMHCPIGTVRSRIHRARLVIEKSMK